MTDAIKAGTWPGAEFADGASWPPQGGEPAVARSPQAVEVLGCRGGSAPVGLNARPQSREEAGATAEQAFATMFAAPADVTEYDLRPLDPAAPHELSTVREAAELFKAAELDVGTARYIWREAQAAMLKPPTSAEIELGAARTMASLARRNGGEAAAAKIVADARSEFARAKSGIPGLATMLNETGLGNNEWLIERLALKARARRGE